MVLGICEVFHYVFCVLKWSLVAYKVTSIISFAIPNLHHQNILLSKCKRFFCSVIAWHTFLKCVTFLVYVSNINLQQKKSRLHEWEERLHGAEMLHSKLNLSAESVCVY